jgi:hypothetical protein
VQAQTTRHSTCAIRLEHAAVTATPLISSETFRNRKSAIAHPVALGLEQVLVGWKKRALPAENSVHRNSHCPKDRRHLGSSGL